MSLPQTSVFARTGGHAFFAALVGDFYACVEADPELRALYPEAELAPAAERLRLFLEQYWGGPATYSEQRGHPRLRLRHQPFAVDDAARARWLACMRRALDARGLEPELDATLWEYFERTAAAMVNTGTD